MSSAATLPIKSRKLPDLPASRISLLSFDLFGLPAGNVSTTVASEIGFRLEHFNHPHASTRHTSHCVTCAPSQLRPEIPGIEVNSPATTCTRLNNRFPVFARSRFFALPLVLSKSARIMRLLERNNAGELSLTKDFVGNDIPEYAMLSHTWGADTEEVTFKDLMDGTGKGKPGYKKIYFCGEQARRDGLQYFWVDTCCIDKSSSAVLSEAIISMFRWYHNAAKCYVYLSDISRPAFDVNKFNQLPWESAFRKSRWFTRGWTLQELLAPASVEFFSKDWEQLGDKKSLERHIHEITGIPVKALQGSPLSNFSVTERLLWAEKRNTTREEDKAYSLLGIFNIQMPPLYGEGRENAFKRLREEIDKPLKGKHTIPVDIQYSSQGQR
jgi:hypothetical protein